MRLNQYLSNSSLEEDMSGLNFPALSANTLFHFTKSIENLIGILTNEFRPRFCLEDFNVAINNESSNEILEFAVPMTCFCDIPLSHTGLHLSAYGDYGIGMSKLWGKKHGIAPVLYAYSGSLITSKLLTMMGRVWKQGEQLAVRKELFDDFYDFMCFVKPYEGDLWREGRKLTNVRFYDEREWRFVQAMSDDFYRYGLTKTEFLNAEIRSEANNKLAEISRIDFEPSDIKYLIVQHESEIVPLIREIERIKGKYGFDDVRLLASRVISAEQIRTDF